MLDDDALEHTANDRVDTRAITTAGKYVYFIDHVVFHHGLPRYDLHKRNTFSLRCFHVVV
jgi:hypothetical protein